MLGLRNRNLWGSSLVCLVSLFLILSPAGAQDLRTLIVGGGPEAQHNQVAIESNVRYVLKSLPASTFRTVLFADGDPKAATVLYEAKTRELSEAERILGLILNGRGGT